jgi:hypothetical protein
MEFALSSVLSLRFPFFSYPALAFSRPGSHGIAVSALANWGEPAGFCSYRRRSVQRLHSCIADRLDALNGALYRWRQN